MAGNSQIIITTHDPLMIGSLRREQVRILRNDRGKSIVEIPYEHPQGMGVAGLLKSEMFGLPSTLDMPTLRKLEERNELLARKAKERLSKSEEAKLARLRQLTRRSRLFSRVPRPAVPALHREDVRGPQSAAEQDAHAG